MVRPMPPATRCGASSELGAFDFGPDQVSRVTGLSSSVLFDKADPRSPVNRRISIAVLTQQAEQDAQRIDTPPAPESAVPDLPPG